MDLIYSMSWPLFILLWLVGLMISIVLMWYGIHCSVRDGTIDKLNDEIQTLKDIIKKEINKFIGE